MPKTTLKTSKKTASLDKYEGRWVALIGSAVIENANTLPELMKKLKRKILPAKPSIMLVPRKDEGPYVLIL